MKKRLLIYLFLLLSLRVCGQCTLNIVLSQPSVATCAGNPVTLTANGGNSYTWYDAASGGNVVGTGQTFTTPALTSSTTYYVVVAANGCTSAPLPVMVNVTPYPQAPTALGATICSGSAANLHATGNSTVFNWFAAPSGGIALISSPDYTTPGLTATTTYYVEQESSGCESPRTPVTVTVNPIPPEPLSQRETICYSSSTILTASGSPGATYQWFDAVAGGTLLAIGANYTTPVLKNSTTYFLSASNGGCSSTRAAVDVIVKPNLSPPAVSGAIICSGSSTTLTASSSGGSYQWYDAPTGGNLISSAATYTTPLLTANTSYYIQNTIDGCVSPRAKVTVVVDAPTAAPIASGTTICSGNTVTLTATGAGNNYMWYNSVTGGNLLSANAEYSTPVLTATTTYYVEAIANGCASTRTPVTVTVNTTPAPPVASGTSICTGASASLTATGSGTISWFGSLTGTVVLATGNTFTTPALFANTTYYVQSSNGVCTSTRTAVTVSIISLTSPQFQYPGGTFCASGPNPVPSINNAAGGVFSAAPMGLVFVDNTTGQINIGASTPGKYTVSFTNNSPCSSTTNQPVTITVSGAAVFGYNGPYCQGGVNPLPTYVPGSSGGNFTATPIGLVFVNTSTGEINLAASEPGTYTVTNTISFIGPCPASNATAMVTISPRVIISAGPAQSVVIGTPVQLAGSISGGIATGTWSGGAGTFSNTSSLNPIYTPGPGETSATLTLTSGNPPGPCGPSSASVIITFGTIPANPMALGAATCFGSTATLTATAPGGNYKWYSAATGGTLLGSSALFTTPPLTANTIYYVQTTINGFTSARTPVTVTVNAIPPAPTAPGTQICSGSTTTLTASGSPGTYEWYSAAAGGNLLSTQNTYTTPDLTTNSSFYVQTVVNGCISARTRVDVSVTPLPVITSAATEYICSGNALNYAITTNLPNATILWSRAAVPGISNAAVANQTSGTISETLINTTTSLVKVTYTITAFNGNCPGPSLNYVVTVYPTPVVTSADKLTICDFSPVNYTINFSVPGTGFSWKRAAVAGISNAAVNGQTAGTIREVLFNTSNAPVTAMYTITYGTSTCTGVPFNLMVTVNPNPVITSPATANACSGVPQNYVISANAPSATYVWTRNVVAGISNPAVSNQTAGTIDEALINTTNQPVRVVYNITPYAFGCMGPTFEYVAIVSPVLTAPAASSNSPVCVASTIQLNATSVLNAGYLWTGPNGFTSTQQNPVVTNVSAANAGAYNLAITLNGCTSPTTSVPVLVDEPPIANAGPDQLVCVLAPSVSLSGNISGGTTTGIWSTAGSGTFSPSNTVLNGQYIPSDADRTSGAVTLTLSSTSSDNCTIATSTVNIKFGPVPAVDAGPDQTVCSQGGGVSLNGKVLIPGGGVWTTSGTGTFTPSAAQLDAAYVPSDADIKSGAVTLTLTAPGADACYIPSDDLTVTFTLSPTVNAGGLKYILKGGTLTLNPEVNENDVSYLWSPDIDISSVTVKDPVITGDADRVYTLTVTNSHGCSVSVQFNIEVAPAIVIDNTFTPNNDGINDVWNIVGLSAYQQATVDIFTRYGTNIFHSVGYDKPFDGTYNGKRLPVGVYYYIIDTKVKDRIFSGYVTIIR